MGMEYLKNTASIKLDSDKCINCGMCITVCPHKVFGLKDNRIILAGKDNCIECGACSKNCPTEAIFVKVGVG